MKDIRKKAREEVGKKIEEILTDYFKDKETYASESFLKELAFCIVEVVKIQVQESRQSLLKELEEKVEGLKEEGRLLGKAQAKQEALEIVSELTKEPTHSGSGNIHWYNLAIDDSITNLNNL